MNQLPPPVVIWGMGEMGGVFARAFLRLGHTVVPIVRRSDPDAAAASLPDPELVLVTVGEADLASALDSMPDAWMGRVGLVQNELLPGDWERAGLEAPTVASVWFEKKPGQDVKVIIPTPVSGPRAELVVSALRAIDIPAVVVSDSTAMRDELVRKNLYILTSNVGGLAVGGGTVAELWHEHGDRAAPIASDVLDIQEWLTGSTLDRPALIDLMVEAFDADPDHKAMGRSAPARLARAIAHADEAGLEVPALRALVS